MKLANYLRRKCKICFLGMILILSFLTGCGSKTSSNIKNETLETEQTTVHKEINDGAQAVHALREKNYQEAFDALKDAELSIENYDEIIALIKSGIKNNLIKTSADITMEKLELYSQYLDIINRLDISATSEEYSCVEYLNQALKLEEYKNYFDFMRYCNSSDYKVREKSIEVALNGGQFNVSSLQSGIEMLNSIDMSVYENTSFAIDKIIEYNKSENECYEKLIQYIEGDTSIDANDVLDNLGKEITDYTLLLVEGLSVINDKITPILDTLPDIN